MSKSAFISRALAADSPFRTLLQLAGFEVYGQSLLKFEPIAYSSPPATDWVFYYSARSVDFFLQGLAQHGIATTAYPNHAALGAGTAEALRKWSITPAFTGSGRPGETAEAFQSIAIGKSVLFPRAEQSRQSVQRLLTDAVEVVDLVVYRNLVDPAVAIPQTDYAALTSPLNVEAYLLKRREAGNTRIVAIGKTTARALELAGQHYRVAGQSSEPALAETILEWERG
jgi:uroporphyrinogen-III synthase